MRDITLDDTFHSQFTTRAFATGVPTTLAGSPTLAVSEGGTLSPITAGITLLVDKNSVTGLNEATIVATGANGYEVGKTYALYVSAGTVGGTSVVGEIIEEFTIEASAATVKLGTPAGATVSADIADIPTVAEFNARTLPSGSYFDPATDTVANVTDVANPVDLSTAGANTVWAAATRTLTSAANITSDASAINVSAGAVTTVTDVTNPVGITAAAANSVWAVATRTITSPVNITSDASAITTSAGAVTTVTNVTNPVGITAAGANTVWAAGTRTLTSAANITSDASAINVTTGVVDTVTDVVNAVEITAAAANSVWAVATRTLTSAANITSDASAINVSAGVVDTVTSVTDPVGITTAAVNSIFTTTVPEGYPTSGAAFTLGQGLYSLHQNITEFQIAGVTITVGQRDKTPAKTYTMDDPNDMTSRTEDP